MTPRHTRHRRRGVASMLAMLYLVLFAILAVGFYATTTVSSQISISESRSVDAQLAAETGMDFMRNALYQVVIPHGISEDNLLPKLTEELKDLLEGTGNLGTNTIELTSGGDRIEIPAGSDKFIRIDAGRRFRAEIERDVKRLDVRVIGEVDGATGPRNRARINIVFDREERPTDFFKTGMASRGPIQILTKNFVKGLPAEQAKVMSLSTVNPPVRIGSAAPSGGSGIAGDIWVPEGTTPSVYAGWAVGGTTDATDIMTNHVHYFDPADVPMPVPVTSIYKPFATEVYVPGKPYYKNIIIPANTNPTINGITVIEGVIYVHQPNKITFNGQVDFTGIIVSEDVGVGTLLTNAIIFSGAGGAKSGLENLPNLPEWDALKRLSGSFIIAPGFDVQMTGTFGSVIGHVVADRVTLSGSSASQVKGAVVGLKSSVTIGGTTDATLVYDPNQGHAGLRVVDRYVPVMSTYEED